MPAQAGVNFKLYDGTGTGTVLIAAQKTTSFKLNRQIVDVTNKDSAGMWREILATAGVVSLDVDAESLLTASTAYQALRSRVPARSNDPYTLVFDNGDSFAGAFALASIEEAGAFDGEQTFKLALQSAGSLAYGTT